MAIPFQLQNVLVAGPDDDEDEEEAEHEDALQQVDGHIVDNNPPEQAAAAPAPPAVGAPAAAPAVVGVPAQAPAGAHLPPIPPFPSLGVVYMSTDVNIMHVFKVGSWWSQNFGDSEQTRRLRRRYRTHYGPFAHIVQWRTNNHRNLETRILRYLTGLGHHYGGELFCQKGREAAEAFVHREQLEEIKAQFDQVRKNGLFGAIMFLHHVCLGCYCPLAGDGGNVSKHNARLCQRRGANPIVAWR